MARTEVALEVGRRRTFARALDWPGWCRAGRGEEGALAALEAARLRYQVVTDRAGVPLPARTNPLVIERLPGDGTTDFGSPGKVAEADRRPLAAREALRQAELVAAAWTVFDEIVAKAPLRLRPGPRGGGRDRDAIAAHVREAEWSYARSLGLRPPTPDTPDAVLVLRSLIVDMLGEPSDGSAATATGWPVRYGAARIAWHVLDHAWEIEDRAE